MITKDKKKSLMLDIILVVSLLTVALSALLIYCLVTGRTPGADEGAVVVVRRENEVIAEFSLSDDGEYEINGGTHRLRIEDGRVSVVSASCPGYQDCVEYGEMSHGWEKIVCLPYMLIITIEGGSE